MHVHGIIRGATLQEHPPQSETIELVVKVQGVGAGQPRTLVIPYGILLADPDLDPDSILGRAFEAEVSPDREERWVVDRIAFASRVLRPPE